MKKGRDQARVGLDEKMRKFSYISGMKMGNEGQKKADVEFLGLK